MVMDEDGVPETLIRFPYKGANAPDAKKSTPFSPLGIAYDHSYSHLMVCAEAEVPPHSFKLIHFPIHLFIPDGYLGVVFPSFRDLNLQCSSKFLGVDEKVIVLQVYNPTDETVVVPDKTPFARLALVKIGKFDFEERK